MDGLKNRKAPIQSTTDPLNGHTTLKYQPNKQKSKPQHQDTWLTFITANIFMLILTTRTMSALYNLVWDCDEVFNYWEPLHFIIFGSGLQTWEYSPAYSLRSYLYIYLHAIPIWPFKLIANSKITIFFMLRFFLAFTASKIETYFFHSLLRATSQTKNLQNLAYFYLAASLTNTGMFLSVTSFLPSTFSMYLVMLAYAAWLNNPRSKLSIFSIGLAVILGWPFAAILGLPIAFDMIYSSGALVHFIKWTSIFGVIITVPTVLFDSYLFGKTVIAPLNIVLYNVFPSSNQGPDLYGKEPLSFYILNCLLNFNILFPILLITPLFTIKNQTSNKHLKVITAAVILWFLVFFTRPHKEERFLYPVYPLIIVLSTSALALTQAWLSKQNINRIFKALPSMVLVIQAVVSLMRIIALSKNFSASQDIYEILNKPEVKFINPVLDSKELINVCVGKEWYRFPSSFFIPEELDESVKKQAWRLRFLESEFKGQLPGQFNEKLSLPESTRFIDDLFNDMNREVKQRYLRVNECDFLIDTDTISDRLDGPTELSYNGVRSMWKLVAKLPFIDMSAANNRFLRAFYVPYLYETQVRITFFKLRMRV